MKKAPTKRSRSNSRSNQQQQNVLDDVGLELVQFSGTVTTSRQINLQTETLLVLEAGPLGRERKGIPIMHQILQGSICRMRGDLRNSAKKTAD